MSRGQNPGWVRVPSLVMNPRRARTLTFSLGLAAAVASLPARADIAPTGPPPRPDWDEYPAPQPDPPPDKKFERIALALAAIALAGMAARRRLRQSSAGVQP